MAKFQTCCTQQPSKVTCRVVHWLERAKTGHIFVWFLEGVAFFFGVALALLLYKQLETRLNPVVTEWQITKFEKVGLEYTMEGWLYKNRNCEFVSASVLAVPKIPLAPRVLLFQLRTETPGGNVPVGKSTWGPINLRLSQEMWDRRGEITGFDIIGTHRCHALWTQDSYYGSVPVDRLN